MAATWVSLSSRGWLGSCIYLASPESSSLQASKIKVILLCNWMYEKNKNKPLIFLFLDFISRSWLQGPWCFETIARSVCSMFHNTWKSQFLLITITIIARSLGLILFVCYYFIFFSLWVWDGRIWRNCGIPADWEGRESFWNGGGRL